MSEQTGCSSLSHFALLQCQVCEGQGGVSCSSLSHFAVLQSRWLQALFFQGLASFLH